MPIPIKQAQGALNPRQWTLATNRLPKFNQRAPSNLAARLVLVSGYGYTNAGAVLNVHRANVRRAVLRILTAWVESRKS